MAKTEVTVPASGHAEVTREAGNVARERLLVRTGYDPLLPHFAVSGTFHGKKRPATRCC